MKYYLIAGEASGDLHASNLMKSLKNLDANADFRFFGGDLMQAQGGVPVKHYRELAYMGFIPVITHFPVIMKNMELCKKDIAEYRVKSFKKYVDEMLCILPFEVDFFLKHNYRVHYVGNPTVDAIVERDHQNETFAEFVEANRLESKPVIALLAGSRKQEISGNLPMMLRAVKSFEGYQFLIAGAPGIDRTFYDTFIENQPVKVLFGQTYRILAQSEAALVTSGTATLETALLNVPQIVCYRTPVPQIAYWGFKHILHTPFISLVNLICGREVVKELFAVRFTEANIRQELHRLLNVQQYRNTMLQNYAAMRRILGDAGASDRAASYIFQKITSKARKNNC
jgi:lipid-A-disaccharide synthase